MKYLFSLLVFFSLTASAQKLDTVYVRDLTFPAEAWAVLVGSVPDVNQDSATSKTFRKIRNAIRAVPNIQWSTNVTIDSLPGYVVLWFYNQVKYGNAGEVVSIYTTVVNSISSKTNMSYWIGAVDGILTTEYNRKRDRGRAIIMDN